MSLTSLLMDGLWSQTPARSLVIRYFLRAAYKAERPFSIQETSFKNKTKPVVCIPFNLTVDC